MRACVRAHVCCARHRCLAVGLLCSEFNITVDGLVRAVGRSGEQRRRVDRARARQADKWDAYALSNGIADLSAPSTDFLVARGAAVAARVG